MKFLFLLFGFLCCSCVTISCFSKKEYNIKDAYVSVGRLSVISNDKKNIISATGFAIDYQHVVSAGHFCISVFESNVKGTFPEKIDISIIHHNSVLILYEQLEIEEIDEKLDICILRGDHRLIPLAFGNFDKIEIGDKISVLGAPLFMFPVLSEGWIIEPRFDMGNEKEKREMLFVDVHVSQGTSGSPVLNERGEVIGMVIMQIVSSPALSADSPFAIAQRGDIIQNWISKIKLEENW